MSGFGDGYVGNSADVARIRRVEKQREEAKKKYEEQAKAQREKAEAAALRQFGASTSEALEHAFKNETIGLVTKQEFIQKRTTLQERLEDEERRAREDAQTAAALEKEQRRNDKLKRQQKAKLSFLGGDDEEEEEEEEREEEEEERAGDRDGGAQPLAFSWKGLPSGDNGAAANGGGSGDGAAANGSGDGQPAANGGDANGGGGDGAPAFKRPKLFGKLGKDPSVATNFLPDREREAAEEALRVRLKSEYLVIKARVEAERNEPIEITYSYWDGTGHRRKVTVRKGDSIGGFLKKVRDQLASEFRELRSTSVDNLIYIKEDLILPHHHTFHELIVNKARGKSGPLFDFSVREDVRIVNDASVEKSDSHAGKVVERHWYDKNKHIFPASRWEIYDPDKVYDKYTVHDYITKH